MVKPNWSRVFHDTMTYAGILITLGGIGLQTTHSYWSVGLGLIGGGLLFFAFACKASLPTYDLRLLFEDHSCLGPDTVLLKLEAISRNTVGSPLHSTKLTLKTKNGKVLVSRQREILRFYISFEDYRKNFEYPKSFADSFGPNPSLGESKIGWMSFRFDGLNLVIDPPQTLKLELRDAFSCAYVLKMRGPWPKDSRGTINPYQ